MPYVLLVNRDDDAGWVEQDSPTVFATGAEAAEAARDLNTFNKERGVAERFRVREVEAPDWRARERRRFADGHYEPVPFCDESWYEERHGELFAHMSHSRIGCVAYTASEERGAQDRQSVRPAEEFLRENFAGALSEDALQHWALECDLRADAVRLHFARASRRIKDVYRAGPRSCMSHATSEFHCAPHHPVEAYGDDSDLTLAYLRRRDDRGGWRVTARALVWGARRVHGRLYGDERRLGAMLRARGYSLGSFDGARLNRLVHRDAEEDRPFVVPYIDSPRRQSGGSVYVADAGDHLVVVDRDDEDHPPEMWGADGTEGYPDEHVVACSECGDRRPARVAPVVPWTGERVCASCLNSLDIGFMCPECREVHPADVGRVRTAQGWDVCESCLRREEPGDGARTFTSCARCGEVVVEGESFQCDRLDAGVPGPCLLPGESEEDVPESRGVLLRCGHCSARVSAESRAPLGGSTCRHAGHDDCLVGRLAADPDGWRDATRVCGACNAQVSARDGSLRSGQACYEPESEACQRRAVLPALE